MRACLIGLLLAILPIAAATAGDGGSPDSAGWKLWSLSSVPATRFTDLGDGRIDVVADSSFGLLYRSLGPEERARRRLLWRWRVDTTIPPTDLSRRGGDDRPLAVHVWFPDTDSGLLSRFGRSLAHSLAGVPLTGKVLTYVWGGALPRETLLPNPYFEGDGVLIVLRGATDATGEWRGEAVDIAADFRRAFGRPAPAPTHIAISADTDDGRGKAAGSIDGLRFVE